MRPRFQFWKTHRCFYGCILYKKIRHFPNFDCPCRLGGTRRVGQAPEAAFNESGAFDSDLIILGHPCRRHQLRSSLVPKSARAGAAAAATVRSLEDQAPRTGRVRLPAPVTGSDRACSIASPNWPPPASPSWRR